MKSPEIYSYEFFKNKKIADISMLRENGKNNTLVEWHKRMKRDNPKRYSQIQRERWLKALKSWESKDIRQKAVKSLKERYGKNYFRELGLKGSSNQKLTKREELVKKKISNMDFDVEHHKTILDNNFDFAYKKENELKAVEEVLGFKKKKSLIFYEILVLYEKYKKLIQKYKIPFFVSTWYEVDLKYKKERFPMELLIWASKKGMHPILMDSDFFNNLREQILSESTINNFETIGFLKNNLKEREHLLKRGAVSQSNQSFDKLEQKVHDVLETMCLNPHGKKLMKTKYNTFTVPDNYFEINGEKIAVFVSKTDLVGIIGSAAIVKELISPKIKTIGLIENKDKIKLKTNAQNTLLNSYVDYFYSSLSELEENKFMGP